MTLANRWPQVGDPAVDLCMSTSGRDRVGPSLTIRKIDERVVITDNGEKYDRVHLRPVSEGRYSAHKLMPAGDPRVLVARGREHLTAMARLAANLADLDHRTPESVMAALGQIVATANVSRVAVGRLMADASRAEQESNR